MFYSPHANSFLNLVIKLRGKTKDLKKQESSSLLSSYAAIPLRAAKLQIYFETGITFFKEIVKITTTNMTDTCKISEYFASQ